MLQIGDAALPRTPDRWKQFGRRPYDGEVWRV